MIVGDQPELGPGDVVFVVRRDEAEDVLVPQHDGLVDLGLAEPGLLVPAGEDLDGDAAPAPRPPPHLPVAALADALHQPHLPRDRALLELRVAGAGAAAVLQHLLLRGAVPGEVGGHGGLLGLHVEGDERLGHELVAGGGAAAGLPADEVAQEAGQQQHEDGEADGQHQQQVLLPVICRGIRV